jgi:hypothetical protein
MDEKRVEKAVDTMYRSIARLEKNQWYDDLLVRHERGQSARVDPRVFVAAGSRTLWAGGRPQVLGRLVRRGDLGFDRRSLTALVWAGWAMTSPSTLRAFLRGLLEAKNRRALKAGAGARPVRWSPTRAPLAYRDHQPAAARPSRMSA